MMNDRLTECPEESTYGMTGANADDDVDDADGAGAGGTALQVAVLSPRVWLSA